MASSHAPYVVAAPAASEHPPAPSYHAPMAPPSEPPSPEPPPRRPPAGVDVISVDQPPENPRKGWWRRLGK
jgi:ribonuclease E